MGCISILVNVFLFIYLIFSGKEEELNVIKCRLESEVAVLRTQLDSDQIENMRKKNKSLSQDVFMLKNLVVKYVNNLELVD